MHNNNITDRQSQGLKEIADEELMVGIRQGNSQDFEKLVGRYASALYRFVYRILKDEGEAQDIVQETFLRVYRNASQYNPQYPLRVWIFSIASHLAMNILSSARRRRILFFWSRPSSPEQDKDVPQEEEIMDPATNPEEEFSRQQISQRVRQAIDNLSPRQRIALTLSKLEGLSYKEIAKIMNINISAVESLIFRAKRKIQREIG
ncbi:MAG: sigma-70 family RNA polymerase sigma factor [bacterium]|nr:sigma-70 family RNA polymerase sigma factor [bacterium]